MDVTLEFDQDCLLRQMAADLGMTPGEMASVLLGSSLEAAPVVYIADKDLTIAVNAAIRLEFDVLTSPATGLSARRACFQLAKDHGVSYRHIWRILKEAS